MLLRFSERFNNEIDINYANQCCLVDTQDSLKCFPESAPECSSSCTLHMQHSSIARLSSSHLFTHVYDDLVSYWARLPKHSLPNHAVNSTENVSYSRPLWKRCLECNHWCLMSQIHRGRLPREISSQHHKSCAVAMVEDVLDSPSGAVIYCSEVRWQEPTSPHVMTRRRLLVCS